MKSPLRQLALAALCTLAIPALAARPMVTDDARIVDAKGCQLESWYRSSHEAAGQLWAVPACNPTGNLELSVGGALEGQGGDRRLATGLVQGKTIFKPLQPNDWGWGLAVGRSLDRPLGRARVPSWYAYAPVSVSLRDDNLVVHLNLGLRSDRGTDRTHGTWGLGSELRLASQLQLVTEVYGESGSRPFVHGGLRYWVVPDRVQVDTTIGARLERGTSERWMSLGLRLLSPPFLP
jgi:hypothetical protein